MTMSALTAAKYFLSIPDEDSGELVSNLKLQKLLYYTQGYHMAVHGKPMFNDKIYAWKHGPVVKTVYNHYSKYANQALPKEKKPSGLSEDNQKFLDEIYRTFGRYSAWTLRDKTHNETPWLKNYKPDVLDVEIPLSDLKEYFEPHVRQA